ncbi:AraC family transcriptional regulator, partial [Catenibacterium sp. GCM10023432]|uniref:AraC family transcriptional regulator n=1 Tax=Catenibacterium sp. GCM10023432 TaxID=3252638 RepID=UPI00360B78B2
GVSITPYYVIIKIWETPSYFKLPTIAASVGFIDALAFSKKFSKTYHCSPTQYRKQTDEKKN